MEVLLGWMVINMKVNLRPIILKVLEDIPGLMEESMRDFGRTTKCTVRERLFGLMEENTKESI